MYLTYFSWDIYESIQIHNWRKILTFLFVSFKIKIVNPFLLQEQALITKSYKLNGIYYIFFYLPNSFLATKPMNPLVLGQLP